MSMVPDRALSVTAKQADNLKGLVQAEFDALHSTMGLKKIGPALSVAQDLRTGRISPVFRNNPDGKTPDNLSGVLAHRLDSAPEDVISSYANTARMGSHAEIYAVNDLLTAHPGSMPW